MANPAIKHMVRFNKIWMKEKNIYRMKCWITLHYSIKNYAKICPTKCNNFIPQNSE